MPGPIEAIPCQAPSGASPPFPAQGRPWAGSVSGVELETPRLCGAILERALSEQRTDSVVDVRMLRPHEIPHAPEARTGMQTDRGEHLRLQ